VLTITQILRSHGVVEKFVEFYGEGLATMSVADRATLANMAPEYGATIGFFPVDEQTLSYLRLTGRDEKQIDLVERYCKEQGLWREKSSEPDFSEVLALDLSSVVPSIAGPRRPQDRLDLRAVKQNFHSTLVDVFKKAVGEPATPRLDRWSAEAPVTPAEVTHAIGRSEDEHEAATAEHLKDEKDSAVAVLDDRWQRLTHGDVVIAAITSCTNTSNPSVMIAAGLVAKKAVEKGLRVPPYVKTSLAPARGSSPIISTSQDLALTSTSSASIRSATAARRALGTPARCPSPSPMPSSRATSLRLPSSPATATSKAGSIRT